MVKNIVLAIVPKVFVAVVIVIVVAIVARVIVIAVFVESGIVHQAGNT